MNRARLPIVVFLIVSAAVLRAFQFEWNLVPIGALALFCGAWYRNHWLALAVPLGAMALGDVFLGIKHHNFSFYTFHRLVPLVYGCYVFNVVMGIALQRYWDRLESRGGNASRCAPAQGGLWQPIACALKTRVLPIAATTLAGSVIFYLVTNLGDWYLFNTYAHNWRGLLECYTAAIPFFRHGTLLGDVLGSALLFGGSYALGLFAAPQPESEHA